MKDAYMTSIFNHLFQSLFDLTGERFLFKYLKSLSQRVECPGAYALCCSGCGCEPSAGPKRIGGGVGREAEEFVWCNLLPAPLCISELFVSVVSLSIAAGSAAQTRQPAPQPSAYQSEEVNNIQDLFLGTSVYSTPRISALKWLHCCGILYRLIEKSRNLQLLHVAGWKKWSVVMLNVSLLSHTIVNPRKITYLITFS